MHSSYAYHHSGNRTQVIDTGVAPTLITTAAPGFTIANADSLTLTAGEARNNVTIDILINDTDPRGIIRSTLFRFRPNFFWDREFLIRLASLGGWHSGGNYLVANSVGGQGNGQWARSL